MGFVILFNSALIILFARPHPIRRSSGPLVEWQSFCEPAYSLFAIGIFFILWGVYIAYFYVCRKSLSCGALLQPCCKCQLIVLTGQTTTYSDDIIHVSNSDSLKLLIILNAAGIPGRIIPALLADLYFGPLSTLIPFSLGAGILLLSWIKIRNFGGFETFVIMYGVCANAVQTLFPSALASLTSDVSKMGVRTGMVFTIGSIACLTGTPIAGALISAGNGSFVYLQIFGGTSVILGSIVLLMARMCFYNSRENDCRPCDR